MLWSHDFGSQSSAAVHSPGFFFLAVQISGLLSLSDDYCAVVCMATLPIHLPFLGLETEFGLSRLWTATMSFLFP
jgi:hypothetical protein